MVQSSSLLALSRLHRRLLRNGLAGLGEAEYARRGAETGGFPAGVVAHVVDARRFLATLVGTDPRHSALDVLKALATTDDPDVLPSMPDLLAAWEVVSDALETGLQDIGADALTAPSGQDFPIDDESLRGGIVFLLHHEAYHIGQLGLLRRQLGHPPLQYG